MNNRVCIGDVVHLRGDLRHNYALRVAEAAGLSVDMISKIEIGATGARFPSIERLAQAVQVDPAELFTSHLPSGVMNRGAFGEITAKLPGDVCSWG